MIDTVQSGNLLPPLRILWRLVKRLENIIRRVNMITTSISTNAAVGSRARSISNQSVLEGNSRTEAWQSPFESTGASLHGRHPPLHCGPTLKTEPCPIRLRDVQAFDNDVRHRLRTMRVPPMLDAPGFNGP